MRPRRRARDSSSWCVRWFVARVICAAFPACSQSLFADADLVDLGVSFSRQAFPIAVVFLLTRGTLGRIEEGTQPALVEQLRLRDLRFIEIADFGNRGLLRVRQRLARYARFRIALLEALHRDFERGLHGLVVGHVDHCMASGFWLMAQGSRLRDSS